MAIYAISDLHLSFRQPKPMDVFGDNWENHTEKIKKNWRQMVKEQDTVLIPGDFSWEMKLEDTNQDFTYLNNLPGKKLLLKGNHDYWWTTLNKMRQYLENNQLENIDFIYNNSYLVEDTIIVGTRGWCFNDSQNSEKILQRENIRLEISLEDGIKKYGKDKKIIVCMHYPPINTTTKLLSPKVDFLDTMQKYSVTTCIYGHLHGASHKDAVEGMVRGIQLKLVSGDYTDFNLVPVS